MFNIRFKNNYVLIIFNDMLKSDCVTDIQSDMADLAVLGCKIEGKGYMDVFSLFTMSLGSHFFVKIYVHATNGVP